VDESSIELVRDVARASNGPVLYFYAPMILPDAATTRALRTQPEVARAVSRFSDVTKAVVGVGTWRAGGSTVAEAVTEQERREMYDLGVRAELCGIQIDDDGELVTTALTERLIGIDAAQLRAIPEVIAIVYGAAKAHAVRAAMRGGFVTSLVTHTGMAHALLEG
jgi:DNA-binding transcriptional regulator LsrR (DeoR family)